MKSEYIVIGRQVLQDEVEALRRLDAIRGEDFNKACRMIDGCVSRVVFIGIGHSGHVAAKSASSFSSLGILSFFLHAAEAVHSELGAVAAGDVAILISNSGETAELLALLPRLKEVGAQCIGIVGNAGSTLARHCDVVLSTGFTQEAGPLKFAGSSSGLLALALCDMLGMAVASDRGLTAEAYSKHHPGGAVGASLHEK